VDVHQRKVVERGSLVRVPGERFQKVRTGSAELSECKVLVLSPSDNADNATKTCAWT